MAMEHELARAAAREGPCRHPAAPAGRDVADGPVPRPRVPAPPPGPRPPRRRVARVGPHEPGLTPWPSCSRSTPGPPASARSPSTSTGRARCARVPRVPAALPATRVGRARRRRDLGGRGRDARRSRRRGHGRDGEAVAAIGITNQRETTVVWDRATGRPRHRAIVWQDRRTAARCDELRAAGHEPLVRARTGLVARPLLLGDQARVAADAGGRRWRRRRRVLAFGTVDSWLLWHLTGGAGGGVHATDPSNASRTLLFDIDALDWSTELLDLFGVPASCLPRVLPSSGRFGVTVPTCAAGLRVPGQRDRRRPAGRAVRPGVLRPGHDEEHVRHRIVRARQPRPERPAPADGLLTSVAWTIGGTTSYAMEGAVFVTGAAIQWLRDGLGVDRRRRRDRAARRERPRHRRRRVRPRVHRARLTVVGPVRARRDPRHHARHHPRAHRARGGRGDGVADASTSSTRSPRRPAARSTSCASTAARA